MAKSKQNKGKKNPPSNRKQNRRIVGMDTSPAGLDRMAMQYRALLRDPCNAMMVPPVSLGPTSGLLVRQRYYVAISKSENVTTSSFVAVLTPAKGTLRTISIGNGQWVETDLEIGILAQTICRAYRCVAGCMKWIPTGSIMDRSGMINTGYILDEVNSTTLPSGNSLSEWQGLCPKTVSNTGNGDAVEVRWLPSGPEDLEFRARGVTYNADTGTCLMVGKDIDYAAGATSVAKGLLEVTIVWEWLPSSGAGIVSPLQVGSKSTLQQVLSTVGNLTSFVLDTPMGRAARSYGMQRAVNYVTGNSMITGREL